MSTTFKSVLVLVVYPKTEPARQEKVTTVLSLMKLLLTIDNQANRITASFVEKNKPVFSVGPNLDKLEKSGFNTSEPIFQDCRVPRENYLGRLSISDPYLHLTSC